MSDKKFSLFELHFHEGVQLGPRTLGGPGGDAEADDEAASASVAEAESETDSAAEDGPCVVCRLVGLGVLAAAAYAVKKLLDGEPGGLDALDDIETGIEDESDEGESENAVSIEVTSGEESSGRKGVVAAVVALLVLVALAARKLLGDSVEEIELPDELAEE